MSERDITNTLIFIEQMLPIYILSLILATLIVGSVYRYFSVEIAYLKAYGFKL